MVGYDVYQNFLVVFLEYSQREDVMLKTIVWKFISDKSASENLSGLVLITPESPLASICVRVAHAQYPNC